VRSNLFMSVVLFLVILSDPFSNRPRAKGAGLEGYWVQSQQLEEGGPWVHIAVAGMRSSAAPIEYLAFTVTSPDVMLPERIEMIRADESVLHWKAYFGKKRDGQGAETAEEIVAEFLLRAESPGVYVGTTMLGEQSLGTTRFERLPDERALLVKLQEVAEQVKLNRQIVEETLPMFREQLAAYEKQIENDRAMGRETPSGTRMMRDVAERQVIVEEWKLRALVQQEQVCIESIARLRAVVGR
jgi:hypothetical protein